MSLPRLNILISGLSVSGDVDTAAQPVLVQPSNTDAVGYASFALQNVGKAYTTILNSGPATAEVLLNSKTVFKGTIEKIENMVSVNRGHVTVCHAYGPEQELLGLISADARLSGDDGTNLHGVGSWDMVLEVSGVNLSSGATVHSFLSHFYGTDADKDGLRYSFKPSGITTDTWYYSGSNNTNFYIRKFEVRREYAWDALRKLMREGEILDSNGNLAAFEMYTDVSGGIHAITSGSSEFFASGPGGPVTLTYYRPSVSGSERNNVLSLTIPYDSTNVKNYVIATFPPWTAWPLDRDLFTDTFGSGTISGSLWSGISPNTDVTTSGPYQSTIGTLSWSFLKKSGLTSNLDVIYSHPISFSISGFESYGPGNVSITMAHYFDTTAQTAGFRSVKLIDSAGNSITKSGGTTGAVAINNLSGWRIWDDYIFSGGIFMSGGGQDNVTWKIDTGTMIDFTKVKQIQLGYATDPPANAASGKRMNVDFMYFRFHYPFSPVSASNADSITRYKRRYALFEYPVMVDLIHASGIINHYLNSRAFPVQSATAVVKDNPLGPPAQLYLNAGQVVEIDAPDLNTGSGQVFRYWRLENITHTFSHQQGFITAIQAIPWFSGTLTNVETNQTDFTVVTRVPSRPANPRSLAEQWALMTWQGYQMTFPGNVVIPALKKVFGSTAVQ